MEDLTLTSVGATSKNECVVYPFSQKPGPFSKLPKKNLKK
jgi:hypothetical protein